MELKGKELAAQLLRLADTDVDRCIQCGRCSASCPMGDKMDLLPSRKTKPAMAIKRKHVPSCQMRQ